jgi:hypothetical protein
MPWAWDSRPRRGPGPAGRAIAPTRRSWLARACRRRRLVLPGEPEDGEAAPSAANGTDPLRPPGHRRLVRPAPARPGAAGDERRSAARTPRHGAVAARPSFVMTGNRGRLPGGPLHLEACAFRHFTRLAEPRPAPPADAACQNLGCAPGAGPLPGAPARYRFSSSLPWHEFVRPDSPQPRPMVAGWARLGRPLMWSAKHEPGRAGVTRCVAIVFNASAPCGRWTAGSDTRGALAGGSGRPVVRPPGRRRVRTASRSSGSSRFTTFESRSRHSAKRSQIGSFSRSH